MGVASIYLTQPVFSFWSGSQQFIMSPLGKSPNGMREATALSLPETGAQIAFRAWMNSCEPPLPQPSGEGKRSFLNVFLPRESPNYPWGQTQTTAHCGGMERLGLCRKNHEALLASSRRSVLRLMSALLAHSVTRLVIPLAVITSWYWEVFFSSIMLHWPHSDKPFGHLKSMLPCTSRTLTCKMKEDAYLWLALKAVEVRRLGELNGNTSLDGWCHKHCCHHLSSL